MQPHKLLANKKASQAKPERLKGDADASTKHRRRETKITPTKYSVHLLHLATVLIYHK